MVDLAHDLAAALDPVALARRAGWGPDPWQAEVLRSTAPRSLLLCARQTGKSTTTAVLALHRALYHPGSLILLLSPSLRQSGELFRKVMDAYSAVGRPVPVAGESALRLELDNGSRVVSLPGQEATIRGYSGVALLVVDEAARVADDLYYSIRPMLAVSGGRLVALSTPFGKRGWFHSEWTGSNAWTRVKVPAAACSRISPAFLAEERAALGNWWYSQEYLCEFRDTVDSVFTFDAVMGALSSDVAPLFGGARA